MEETKLTVRVPKVWLEDAKEYARQHNTTLTRLVGEYLRQFSGKPDFLEDAPIVRRLSGILSQDVNIEDYRKYLEEKYGK
ncbi:MAG: hypothetical protein A2W33_07010 [Chloroflexi bacterium RBG_16_52_11]|nr:MAG: hypothetical protein A2W33_07010 [Chloroflexi bacterium RBG_16_52_11]